MEPLVTHELSNDFDTAKGQIIENFVKIQQGVADVEDRTNLDNGFAGVDKKLNDMQKKMNSRISSIVMGTDEDTIRLVVTAILQEQGVIK